MFGDLIKIGWITSKPNIEKVTQDLVKLDADTCDTVVILDLFSNSVYRYRHASVMKPCSPFKGWYLIPHGGGGGAIPHPK